MARSGLLSIALAPVLGACTLSDRVIHNVADVDDHLTFANRRVAAAPVLAGAHLRCSARA